MTSEAIIHVLPGSNKEGDIQCYVVARLEVSSATEKLEISGYYNGIGFTSEIKAAFYLYCVACATSLAQRLRNSRNERYIKVYAIR